MDGMRHLNKEKAQLEGLVIGSKNIFSIKPREKERNSMQFPDTLGRTEQKGKGAPVIGRSLGLLMELRGKAVGDREGARKEF